MNCTEIKNILALKTGVLDSDHELQAHLSDCPDCMEYYNRLKSLQANLSELPVPEISPIEFAMVQEKLDKRINSYQNRAVVFYNRAIGYGSAAAAVFLIFIVSLVTQYGVIDINELSVNNDLLENTIVVEEDEDSSLGREYFDIVLSDYLQKSSIGSSDLLIGELQADEIEYLEKNLNVGDLL